jgi:hypothetical protein
VPAVHVLMTWWGVGPNQHCHHRGDPHHTNPSKLSQSTRSRQGSQVMHATPRSTTLDEGRCRISATPQCQERPRVPTGSEEGERARLGDKNLGDCYRQPSFTTCCASSCTATPRLAQSVSCVAHFVAQVYTGGGICWVDNQRTLPYSLGQVRGALTLEGPRHPKRG